MPLFTQLRGIMSLMGEGLFIPAAAIPKHLSTNPILGFIYLVELSIVWGGSDFTTSKRSYHHNTRIVLYLL